MRGYMRFEFVALIAIFVAVPLLAGNLPAGNPLEKSLTQRMVTCHDVEYNAQTHILRYFAQSKMDSAEFVKTYADRHCGPYEWLFRLNILQRIMAQKPVDHMIDGKSMTFILRYKNRRESIRQLTKTPRARWFRVPARFDSLTVALAKSIDKANLPKLEKMFVTLYQDSIDSFFDMVYAEPVDNDLSRLFWQAVKKAASGANRSWGFQTGVWFPLGSAKIVGNHPLIGCYVGGGFGKITAEFDMNFKFLKSRNVYIVEQDGVDYDTDHFFGGYIGLDVSVAIEKGRKHSFNLLSGIAFDGWDALEKDEAKGVKAQGIFGHSVNLGLGYHRYYSTLGCIGIDARYNFTNFSNDGGTDVSGNAITVVLRWGFFGNISRIYRFKQLKYNGPKLWK